MLRTARLVGKTRVPILGSNFGHLGFLVNSSEDGVIAIVAAALAGDVVREGEQACISILVPTEKWVASRFALNEFSVTRNPGPYYRFRRGYLGQSSGGYARGWTRRCFGNGVDGLCSSAGGPLVAPDFKGLVVVPLAPPYVAVPLYRDRRARAISWKSICPAIRKAARRAIVVVHQEGAYRSYPGSQVQ